jgi:beta-lactamase superfamily II metal-dependent hydrolase
MLTITFKNVDQGDTIILEWQNDSNEREIGIIDCHLKNGGPNLAVEHILENGYKNISFMIMTHPHTDHFSGFLSLLDFCEEHKIEVNDFMHTANLDKKHLEQSLVQKVNSNHLIDSFVTYKKERNNLKRLFRKIDDLHNDPNSILEEASVVNNKSKIILNKRKGLFLEILSPSEYDEKKQYQQYTFTLNSEGRLDIRKNQKRENNPKANLLSSFIRIFSGEWQILLPSDSEKSSIERIMNMKKYNKLFDDKLLISQIPHHGSLLNHYENFWINIPGKKNTPVFISVGEKYGHPSRKVVEFFDENYKEIHSTNFVGGLKEYFECKEYKNEDISHINSLFDMCEVGFNECKTPADSCGEKQIKIEEDGTFNVFTNS